MHIAFEAKGACIDCRDVESDPYFVDIVPKVSSNVPGFDVVESHDQVRERFEECDGQFADVLVMGFDIEERVYYFDGLLGH